jgi:hypothetical protein
MVNRGEESVGADHERASYKGREMVGTRVYETSAGLVVASLVCLSQSHKPSSGTSRLPVERRQANVVKATAIMCIRRTIDPFHARAPSRRPSSRRPSTFKPTTHQASAITGRRHPDSPRPMPPCRSHQHRLPHFNSPSLLPLPFPLILMLLLLRPSPPQQQQHHPQHPHPPGATPPPPAPPRRTTGPSPRG